MNNNSDLTARTMMGLVAIAGLLLFPALPQAIAQEGSGLPKSDSSLIGSGQSALGATQSASDCLAKVSSGDYAAALSACTQAAEADPENAAIQAALEKAKGAAEQAADVEEAAADVAAEQAADVEEAATGLAGEEAAPIEIAVTDEAEDGEPATESEETATGLLDRIRKLLD